MNDAYEGFVKLPIRGPYNVISNRVAPESLLATECLVNKLLKLSPQINGAVLDLGCSTKPYKPLFDSNATQYVGLDVPFSDHTKKFIDVMGRGEHLPFRNETFDAIICTEVLEHVPDPSMTLSEIRRVLKHGGTVIVSVPFMYRVHEAPYDYYRYTPFAMRHLAKAAGLTLEQVTVRGGFLTVFSDICIKGAGLGFGAVRRGLKLEADSISGKAWTILHRGILSSVQKILWLLLKDEKIASDRFTLGYVFVLGKHLEQNAGIPQIE